MAVFFHLGFIALFSFGKSGFSDVKEGFRLTFCRFEFSLALIRRLRLSWSQKVPRRMEEFNAKRYLKRKTKNKTRQNRKKENETEQRNRKKTKIVIKSSKTEQQRQRKPLQMWEFT